MPERVHIMPSIFWSRSVPMLGLFLTSMAALGQQPVFTPFRASGIYQLGEKVGWTVTQPEARTDSVRAYIYTIRENELDLVKSGTIDLATGPATIATTLNEPAMLYVEVTPNPSARETLTESPAAAIHLGAAIAPEQLKPSVPRPADFDSFWDAKLKALSQIPINPVLTVISTTQTGVDLYTVKLDSVDSHVQGYLATPAKPGKFPALVVFQYAGVYALHAQTVTSRAAEGWLAFDVDSHDLPPDQSTGVPKNYGDTGNTSRDTSYFLDMYLRDSRAIDYIASRPDWDGKTIVITGASMGGQQSLAAAALNPKVSAVLVNEPAGADSNGNLHGRKAGYPNWPSDDPRVMQTALYFDTVNFASRIKAPVLAAMGFIDTTCPPVGIWIALDQIPGAKEAVPMIESDHNNKTPEKQGAYNVRLKEVLELLLHGATWKPAGLLAGTE